ncbi:hypothetical protein ACA910_014885 [Epithemia clementina (nom. ined.)]
MSLSTMLKSWRQSDNDAYGNKLTPEDAVACAKILENCEMFQKVPPELLVTVVDRMTVRHVNQNEKFVFQGQPCDRFYLLEQGEIVRKHFDEASGKKHVVKFEMKASSINTMRILSGAPYHNTISCVSKGGCKLYEMKRTDFIDLLKRNPDLSIYIADGLSEALKQGSKKFVTPLLEQQQQDLNVPVVAIAAGIESYYRSALNAQLNAQLSGVKSPQWFPNMHVQVPVRIAYITGFKGLRAMLENWVDPDEEPVQPVPFIQQWRLAAAIAPGIIMTPIASILEASNAGHLNSEPLLTKRWMRGFVPRMGREIVFGLGLNQLSDYFEERWYPILHGSIDSDEDKSDGNRIGSRSAASRKKVEQDSVLANAVGSLMAGVVAGYFSHIPHNMSTYKLLEPNKSYGELYRAFVQKSVPSLVREEIRHWSNPKAKAMAETVTATLFPRGLVLRTTQIVGSFIILNGTINFLYGVESKKLRSMMALGHGSY